VWKVAKNRHLVLCVDCEWDLYHYITFEYANVSRDRRPRDPATQLWRPVASLSKFEELDGLKSVPELPKATVDSFASSLCYGCLVPFMELQGPAKKTATLSSQPVSSSRLLPAYVQDMFLSKDVITSQTETNGNAQSDLRSQIESYLL
jgi:hypothetical protein